MTDDFEARLAALLNESVDAQLTTRTVAPPFVLPADVVSDPDTGAVTEVVGGDQLAARRRRRFTFLAVAATVIAIVAAALSLNAFAPHGHKAPPATPPPPALKSVQLGGATLALPANWVVRPISRYQPKGETASNSPQWCLTPASVPVSNKTIFTCPVVFTAYTPSQELMDPDSQLGFYSGGQLPQAFGCFPTGSEKYREVADTRTFGGRTAEFRQWTVTCPKKPEAGYVEQQYTVPTAKGYLLTSYHSTKQIRAGLAVMAANSTLSNRTSALRLADRGYVRSLQMKAGGTRIVITRADRLEAGVKKLGSTATYLVPKSVLARSGPVRHGYVVYIATNGRTVIDLQVDIE